MTGTTISFNVSKEQKQSFKAFNESVKDFLVEAFNEFAKKEYSGKHYVLFKELMEIG